MSHAAGCEGWHTTDISCDAAVAWRAIAADNVWLCWHGRAGYHQFDEPGRDSVCIYDGCTRTRGELYDWLDARGTPPRRDV